MVHEIAEKKNKSGPPFRTTIGWRAALHTGYPESGIHVPVLLPAATAYLFVCGLALGAPASIPMRPDGPHGSPVRALRVGRIASTSCSARRSATPAWVRRAIGPTAPDDVITRIAGPVSVAGLGTSPTPLEQLWRTYIRGREATLNWRCSFLQRRATDGPQGERRFKRISGSP